MFSRHTRSELPEIANVSYFERSSENVIGVCPYESINIVAGDRCATIQAEALAHRLGPMQIAEYDRLRFSDKGLIGQVDGAFEGCVHILPRSLVLAYTQALKLVKSVERGGNTGIADNPSTLAGLTRRSVPLDQHSPNVCAAQG